MVSLALQLGMVLLISIAFFAFTIVGSFGVESETFLGVIEDFDVTISRVFGTEIRCKIFLYNNTIVSDDYVCDDLVSGLGLYEFKRDDFFKTKYYIVKEVSQE